MKEITVIEKHELYKLLDCLPMPMLTDEDIEKEIKEGRKLILFGKERKVEQVPETWEELKELCEELEGKTSDVSCEIINKDEIEVVVWSLDRGYKVGIFKILYLSGIIHLFMETGFSVEITIPEVRSAPVLERPEPRTAMGRAYFFSESWEAKRTILRISAVVSGTATRRGLIFNSERSVEYASRIASLSKTFPERWLFK